MHIVYLKNFRRGLATNSSSTHSLIYRNDDELFKDLGVFEFDYYDRFTHTIAASREAKIKYVLAHIFYHEALTKIMSDLYPEMKQYFPLIRKQMEADKDYENYEDNVFGMYCRDSLIFPNNLEASIDNLRNIIDNDEIIIIGGSDEEGFVYDTKNGHIEHPDTDTITYGKFGHYGVTKNGNYWVGYGDTYDNLISLKDEDDVDFSTDERYKNSSCGKIRFATSNCEIVPEYPELIDLKITDACEHGCPMCYMGATRNGLHANLSFLKRTIGMLRDYDNKNYNRVEFSIGGGNVLLYPDLEELFSYIKGCGHIINVTIKADDCDRIVNDEHLKSIFEKYVDGIGVSIFTVDDAKKLIEFKNEINGEKTSMDNGHKYIVAHLIPEYIGLDRTLEIRDAFNGIWMPRLYLGYKPIGRGATQEYHEFTEDELFKLFDGFYNISVDTTFANRYFWFIKDNFSHSKTLTLNEGEFSMYIDGVNENAYKSSYNLEKPYNLSYVPYQERKDNPTYSIKEAFTEIRKDGGFKTYDEINDHYYAEKDSKNTE